MDLNLQDRARGALLGLATGDALGTTLEFTRPGSFTPLTDITGGGPFDLAPGEWTDDTSMALCLAESLVQCGTFDAHDQMRRYLRWYREGYYSVKGHCFDIGGATA
ncbi:MAG: ADP-ribosylglycohydrolase family protein, partial [Bacteroidetes bacterium]